MRLAKGWHLLLGRDGDRVLSDPLDCCAYGLETSAGTVMFDAGAGRDVGVIERAVSAAGIAGPRTLLLTHGHADHSGGAAFIARRYGAEIFAGAQTAEWLEAADEAAVSLPAARLAGTYPRNFRLAGCHVDRCLTAGEELNIGDASIQAVATPGHSLDHMSYLVRAHGRTALIAGDAIFAGGTVILQDTWDCSVPQTCATIRRLAELDFDLLLPGHGSPVLENGRGAVDTAMQRVARSLPPLNLL
jgi:glyoxylase-like metal-dependent hydrolase (beta-lactamase superfamily II)